MASLVPVTENAAVSDVDQKTKDKAEKFKEEGNVFFKANNYDKAILFYTKAIKAMPSNPVYYANRAFCHIRLENYGSALIDAEKAIEVDSNYPKGYYRRGVAHFALAKYGDALTDFKLVVKLAPADKDAQKKLKDCREAVRLEAFSKAIENEQTRPASEGIDLKTIDVDNSYAGPRLEGPVSLEFVKELIDHFKNQKNLHKKYLYQILLDIIQLLSSLPTLIEIDVPNGKEITVCGDVHGQFYDMLNIFELNGFPSEDNPYLFNGDFVDRGSFSAEIIITFFALKLLYPNHFHLTRGNHESRTMNQIYGFQGEIAHKYDVKAFELFSEAFCWLPLSAVINKKVFVVHGGLFSEDGVTLNDIKKINRNCQPPDHGLMCEVLWSDPQPDMGRGMSKRGVGLAFGPDVTERFLKTNNLEMVVRSHEVKAEGYEVEHNGKLVTVFSAPNYCDQMGNKGAYIRFNSAMKPTYNKFSHVPHPQVRPMQYANPMMSMGV